MAILTEEQASALQQLQDITQSLDPDRERAVLASVGWDVQACRQLARSLILPYGCLAHIYLMVYYREQPKRYSMLPQRRKMAPRKQDHRTPRARARLSNQWN
jgi:hypothetical protein